MATLLDASYFNNVRLFNCGYPGSIFFGQNAGNQIAPVAGTYKGNTFVGTGSGQNIQTGSYNTAFGDNSLYGGGGGAMNVCRNTAIGFRAMQQVFNNSYKNVAIGAYAMQNIQSATGNVAIGKNAAKFISNGNFNTFIGYAAGRQISNGNGNIGIGLGSMRPIGNGNCNIGLGEASFNGLSVGSDNIAIGYYSGRLVTTANYTISVGYCASTSNYNGHTIAGNCFVTTHITQGASWAIASDSRDKTDINMLENNLGLNFIRNLRPVKFNLDIREAYVSKCGFEFGTKDGTLKRKEESYGFIAQEIEDTLNDLNIQFDALKYNEDKSKYKLTYDDLMAPIIKSLQQTIDRLEYLESKV